MTFDIFESLRPPINSTICRVDILSVNIMSIDKLAFENVSFVIETVDDETGMIELYLHNQLWM
jgi:hypothetical protein